MGNVHCNKKKKNMFKKNVLENVTAYFFGTFIDKAVCTTLIAHLSCAYQKKCKECIAGIKLGISD